MAKRSGVDLPSAIKGLIRPLVPAAVREWHRRKMIRDMRSYFGNRSTQEVFTEIYRDNLWGGEKGRFFSGGGSTREMADVYCRAVGDFILEEKIGSIVDLGCGDFLVGSMLAAPHFCYVGVDIVPDLIRSHNARFAGPTVQFRCLNIIEDELPAGELCLIRQVFQHLSNAQILRVLENCQGYRYLIITEHYPDPMLPPLPNLDKPHGPDIRLPDGSGVYLDLPPFGKTISRTLCEVALEDRSVLRTILIEQAQAHRTAGR